MASSNKYYERKILESIKIKKHKKSSLWTQQKETKTWSFKTYLHFKKFYKTQFLDVIGKMEPKNPEHDSFHKTNRPNITRGEALLAAVRWKPKLVDQLKRICILENSWTDQSDWGLVFKAAVLYNTSNFK